ncbi:Iron only hydrogenase large subunit, C-terminal domain [Caminicella sporogenes DSM 14501]|uniref:Iron only hydrogenase large subunit, C-terminal domain n=1 Tax=Caminicella sporogenes DSM 14501 TaxID=1121266 RepID=A0A1M6QJ92_9FIRM|nr:Iron only hydrogenase large subunit, C-terminal domain [Caminicella sporogenes DSM 14501]
MVKLLNISEANCRNCYKCFRSCVIKSIKIENEQAHMVSDTCIYCGQCLKECPQGAIKKESDLKSVKEAIENGKKVVASIAPSFVGNFKFDDAGQLVAGLKKIGFFAVEETAVGAEIVTELYRDYIKKTSKKNLITTCCPSATLLIEKYYPVLREYMIPIVSPMLAHGKVIKKVYGKDSYVVFIGPCISKMYEANEFQHEGTIDAVITFQELDQWLEEQNIDLTALEKDSFNKTSFKTGSGFPISGNIIKNLVKESSEKKYKLIHVTGIEDCITFLDCMLEGKINNVLLELSVCRGGCIGGPGSSDNSECYYIAKNKIEEYVNKKREKNDKVYNDIKEIISKIDFSKKFFDKSIPRQIATEEEITAILRAMGKFKKEDELNCGGCGFNTCRDKAQAVFEGKAELSICLPFMRNKAESISNIMFEYTPNIVFALNEKLEVLEFNPTAEKIFKIKEEDIKNKPISTLIDDSDFINVLVTGKNIIKKKIQCPKYGVTLLGNILHLKSQNVLLAIMTNITSEEKHRAELKKVKENAVKAAQNVIDKQMRVAQEIASLLGETTAETKSTLTKLKKIALEEEGDI